MAFTAEPARRSAPQRFTRPSALAFLAYALGVAVVVWAANGAEWSFGELVTGIPALGDFLSRAWPPSFERFGSLSRALIETFQMAIIGTLVGVILSLPLAIFAARGLTGLSFLAWPARGWWRCSAPSPTSSGR